MASQTDIQAAREMIEHVRTHKAEYNSFNKLADEAAENNPQWLAALCDVGVLELMKTYCHD